MAKIARLLDRFGQAGISLKVGKGILSVPRIAGLLILLLVLSGVVFWTAPPPRTAQEKDEIFIDHQSLYYFIVGESIAKGLLPDPVVRWSHCHLGQGSIYHLADHYWIAQGRVWVPSDGEYLVVPWMACFNSDSDETVFVGVGNDQRGNYERVKELEASVRAENGNISGGP